MSDPITARLAELEQACRRRGIPLTVQRRSLLAALLGRDDHPTAEDLFGAVAAQLPGVSRGTVYRTLDKLVELGLVARVSHPGSAARFDAKTHRHHHAICDRCGAMRDVEAQALDRIALPDLGASGFQVHDYSVHFRGLCRRCRRSGDEAPRRAGTRSSPSRRSKQ
jgi:Fe2+ or Zn2+ uptake regulation protein